MSTSCLLPKASRAVLCSLDSKDWGTKQTQVHGEKSVGEKKTSQRNLRTRQLHNYILVASPGIESVSGISTAVLFSSLSDFLTQLASRLTVGIQLLNGTRYEVTALRIPAWRQSWIKHLTEAAEGVLNHSEHLLVRDSLTLVAWEDRVLQFDIPKLSAFCKPGSYLSVFTWNAALWCCLTSPTEA